MFDLSLRVFFHIALFLVLIIPATLTDNVNIQTEVGSIDKVIFPNFLCQVASRRKICEVFGAQDQVLHGGKNCSCSCPEDANTFGFDGRNCKCLPDSISYGGCSAFSQINRTVLQRDSSTTLYLSSKNCSLAVSYRNKNGTWITVKNITGIITFNPPEVLNGSSKYVLNVSNSRDSFQGALYNVMVQCPKRNSTCFLLKLPSQIACPYKLPPSSTHPPTNSTSMTTTDSNINSSALSKGVIAAIVVSCLIFLAIILLVLFFWIRRKRNQVIKNDRKESQQQMTGDQDVERENSGPVVFSRPNRASTQRKDSANLGFEPDASTCDSTYEDPDYDLPIDEKHSIISGLINKIKRPLSMKKPIPKHEENEDKLDSGGDDYLTMEELENPDNLENAAVYENTINEVVKDELKPEAMQSMYKKIWRPKCRKKEKNLGGQGTGNNEGKIKNSSVPHLSVTKEKTDIPKKQSKDNMELENIYENNEVIRENRAGYSNDVPAEDEEVPPPPPRSTSLEKTLDGPNVDRPIPSPRMRSKSPNIKGKDDINYDNDYETENDPSELYENTRKSSYLKPSPRLAKR
ncbi:uncharacterized protein LOC116304890 [Actinia tenebrosa]|uniref:Uncharacterized protein LOC116304890 n=1 Tax=Actinia tenebrosa TaxID=6105 RepID=A0A6P8IWX3_ACTTE|nr:uncharacterized protein LOC116304890 [Actinia tenebrosa]